MGIENPVHLLFLGAVALLVLGPKRLPELAKALGNGIREFRESIALGEDGEKPASEPASPNGVSAVATAPPEDGVSSAPASAPPQDGGSNAPAGPPETSQTDAPQPPADGAS